MCHLGLRGRLHDLVIVAGPCLQERCEGGTYEQPQPSFAIQCASVSSGCALSFGLGAFVCRATPISWGMLHDPNLRVSAALRREDSTPWPDLPSRSLRKGREERIGDN